MYEESWCTLETWTEYFIDSKVEGTTRKFLDLVLTDSAKVKVSAGLYRDY